LQPRSKRSAGVGTSQRHRARIGTSRVPSGLEPRIGLVRAGGDHRDGDDRRERVAAVVELAPGAPVKLEDLDAHCRANLARYKVPEERRFAVPARNAMGKVIQAEIGRLFA